MTAISLNPKYFAKHSSFSEKAINEILRFKSVSERQRHLTWKERSSNSIHCLVLCGELSLTLFYSQGELLNCRLQIKLQLVSWNRFDFFIHVLQMILVLFMLEQALKPQYIS